MAEPVVIWSGPQVRSEPRDINKGKHFTITSREDKTEFWAFFADGAAIVIDGYGGWQTIPRPRNVAITEWQGRNPIAIEIPFLLDFWLQPSETSPGVDCENQVRNLERLCGIGSTDQPPICKVDANGAIPHCERLRNWVVESVQWDRSVELRNSATNRRLRCGGTITIRQFITARDILRRIRIKKKPKIYRVKKGDTLSKIAKKFYGEASKWKLIADANNIRDRRKKLKLNQKLKIPSEK